jgi:hypothetical protein
MLGGFFSAIIAKFSAIVQWFSDLAVAVFVSLWDIFKDLYSWLFDQVMSVASTAITAIDVSALSGVGAWGAAPAEVMNILALLGVGQAVTIITAAIGIRLALQLIPFVRLGS